MAAPSGMGSQELRGLTQRTREQGSDLASLGLIPQQLSEVSRVGWGWQPGSNKFPGHSQVCEDQSGLRPHMEVNTQVRVRLMSVSRVRCSQVIARQVHSGNTDPGHSKDISLCI